MKRQLSSGSSYGTAPHNSPPLKKEKKESKDVKYVAAVVKEKEKKSQEEDYFESYNTRVKKEYSRTGAPRDNPSSLEYEDLFDWNTFMQMLKYRDYDEFSRNVFFNQ